MFAIVLHPGLKLEYFQQKEWEEEWIDNAENLAYEVYVAQYEGKKGCKHGKPRHVQRDSKSTNLVRVYSNTL
jgi:hypothetical protein